MTVTSKDGEPKSALSSKKGQEMEEFEPHLNPDLLISRDPMQNFDADSSQTVQQMLKLRSKPNQRVYLQEKEAQSDYTVINLDLDETE